MNKQRQNIVTNSYKLFPHINLVTKLMGKEFLGHFIVGAIAGLSLTWLNIKNG
jgi:hypothetical protein